MRSASIAGLVTAALLVAAGDAAAAKLERTGGTIRYTAAAGEKNAVSARASFFPEGWAIESRDGSSGPPTPMNTTAAPDCSLPATSTNTWVCAADVTRWEIFGLDEVDNITAYGAASLIDGGEGNDLIRTGDQADVLRGGPGDEVWLDAGAGADVIEGGAGDDRLFPQDGGDDVRGGPGVDEVTYQYFYDDKPVSVTLDDVANDGVPGAGANIHADVEDILGGEGHDHLVGDADANRLRGGFESPRGNGNDILDGGGGRDTFEAGSESDTLRARDGIAETVDCGDGTDVAIVDTIDTPLGCETVDASADLEPDRDADGFDAPADCDDHDPGIHPGAVDVPENGVDEDCAAGDAQILDRDRDGFARPQDCDDGNPLIHPGVPDALDNGVDEDCRGGDAINFDRDADGVGRPHDCNDADPNVSPSRPESFGNAIDEDCSGRADPYRRLGAEIISRWKTVPRGTKALRLIVSGAPLGAVVELRCDGRGCPPKPKRMTVKSTKDVALRRLLRARQLKPGTVVEVRVSMDGTIGIVARFTFRKGKLPRRASLCLAPGERRPRAC